MHDGPVPRACYMERGNFTMPGKIVLGAQWGDEGKGKYIDIFASQADMVVRS